MATTLTLTRQQLVDLKACSAGLDWFDGRAVDGAITYPNGFDETEIKRLGTQNPFFFRWLVKHGFVEGVTPEQAEQIVVDLRKAQLEAPKVSKK